ncbi:MAG: Ig-like domain-containing protein, partial [Gammaproteobacteria bacterium]
SGNLLFSEYRLIAAGGVWETLTFNLPNVSTIWVAQTGWDFDHTGTYGSGWWPGIDNVRVNEATAVDDGPVSVTAGVAAVIPVGANDTGFTDPVSVAVTTAPTKGTINAISPTGPAAGMTITYTANAGSSGTDSFAYEMTDGTPASDTAAVSVNISPDTDSDGIADPEDNCTLLANPSQCDSDGDGYGNRCDGDLNNNGATNGQDTVLFRQQLGKLSVSPTYNPADMNCNGAVNGQDTTLYRQRLGAPPGPSGVVP